MKFKTTPIPGVRIAELTPFTDARGSFARAFCTDEFAAAGATFAPRQMNLSRNPHRGTLRGLHFQKEPHAEDKLVRCIKGRIFDVAVDLRRDSPTYHKWFGLELDPLTGAALLIPKGCAHGFMTLEADSDVLYLTSHPFTSSHDSGVRWNSAAFNIQWPMVPALISDKDQNLPELDS